MATVTRILETPNVAQFSLVGKLGDSIVANRQENGNTVVLIRGRPSCLCKRWALWRGQADG